MTDGFKMNDACRVYLGNGYVAARYVRSYVGRNGQTTHVVTVAGREKRVASINIARPRVD